MKRSRLVPASWRGSLAACFFLLAGCGLFSDEGRNLDGAEAALTRGDYNEAMILLHGVLESAPDNGRAHLLAARGALMLGDFPAAESALIRAENAGIADTQRVRGELLSRSGQADKLFVWVNQQTFPPDAQWAGMLRVRALVALRRCDEAIPLARSVTGHEYEAAARVAIAQCYARGGNVAQAVRELRIATAGSPNDAEAWLMLGQMLKLVDDRPGADEAWKEASRHAPGRLSIPQQAVMYSSLADLQSERGDVSMLRATHQRLVAILPGAPITELLDARIALLEGKAGDAVTTLRRVTAMFPDLAAGHTLLLAAYLTQKNFEQARQELGWLEEKVEQLKSAGQVRDQLDRLAKSAMDSPEYFLTLANIQGRLGLLDFQRMTLDRGLDVSPSDQELLLAQAQLALRTRRGDDALEFLKPLVKSPDPKPAVLRAQAESLAAVGRLAEADTVFAALMNRAPDRGTVLAWYGLRTRGKLSAAHEPLQQWLAQNPGDSAVRAVYADSLREGGDNRSAIAQYELLVEKNPRVAALLNNLAWVYVLEGDPRAVDMARRATELAPKSSACADTYGWALVRAGSPKEAVPILEAADREAGITRPVTRYHLAAAKAGSGETESARMMLTSLLAEADEFLGREEAVRLLAELHAQTQT